MAFNSGFRFLYMLRYLVGFL